ncbi:hypothetical protein PACILC2_23010 [Paenibacillus cisolokensis]|uniref:N-acetylmuramoyl-L-alanine amidase n=1 Tax=Paenibacillus cisolokensis TaxID=1658519 RepID=A0ABQ4N6C5_9BACL|nr:N-acetylmuramoyl-L-alanine amidase [Paenibacillus cisolokensis]GIQ63733.1 hypothetical protein PACILC2_23010 [Paenibacillus cisolokensis]
MRYVVDHIPRSTPCNRRNGQRITPTTITIHNTGNPRSTARNERTWLTNPSNNVAASYHIVVDENEAIECVPLDERAIHSGTTAGNMTSIGVEICESGNYAKTLDNAAALVAKLLKERGWGVDRLRRHYDWSGKICPRLMYDGGKWTGWTEFKRMVAEKLTEKDGNNEMDKISVKVNGKKVADGLLDAKNGVTYVPVRVVAENLGAKVTWNKADNCVEVTK